MREGAVAARLLNPTMTTLDEEPTAHDVRKNEALGLWDRRGLPDILVEKALAAPDRELIVDTRSRLSYGDVAEQVDRAAEGLRRLGIGPKQCVLVQAPNWAETVIVNLALEALRAVAVPLPPMFREREIRYIAKLTGATAAVIAPRFGNFSHVELYASLRPELPALRHVIVLGKGDDVPAGAVAWDALLEHRSSAGWKAGFDTDPNVVTEIGFTSGSTGDPKGAVHTSNTLSAEHLTWARAHQLGPDDVFFIPSTIGHQLGYSVMRAAILMGGKMLLVDRWEPEACTERMWTEGATFTITTPAFLFDLLRTKALAAHGTLPKMRVWVLAGQVVTSELHKESTTKLPHVRFGRQFGMTEIGSMIVNNMLGPPDKEMATGLIQPGAELRVLDEAMHDVPAGETGELVLRAPSLFYGYLGRRDLTDQCYTAGGFFRTGDEVRVDADGWVFVTGRIKDLIKRGGESVSPAELEDILSGHAKLRDVAVVGIPDERLGERICVCVVPNEGETLTLEELVATVSTAGVARQKWPEKLVVLAELPRTSIGKVHKAVLRDIAVRALAKQADAT